ncbi:probable lactoylglutathione lyase, chloroplastic [Arachis ipaensis]|uniref:probable lactoylglutathione lyase, chloroplastic n=1 Tax=Arachis ipaensis TaxID=130454 RepID=UPI000A2AF497|nr:probable lactoylglutathione lyase, chloroplastic [Arachis ipaensis]
MRFHLLLPPAKRAQGHGTVTTTKVKNDNRRFLHVVYRVGDLDKTIKFYTKCLGMKLLRKRDIPEERYTNSFLGYGPEDSNFTVELTYNYGVDKYDIGNGFGHLGVVVEDVGEVEERRREVAGEGVVLEVDYTAEEIIIEGVRDGRMGLLLSEFGDDDERE